MTGICFDRSRILCGQRCLRERYWRYHWGGIGLERIGFAFAPETGQQVHKGLELIINDAQPDAAVNHVLADYRSLISQHRPDAVLTDPATLEQWEQWDREAAEQLWITEALIRGWAASEYHKLMAEYETIATEREEFKDFAGDGRLMARCDWLVRRKADRSLFIFNFKTVGDASKFWRDQWRYDMCTISESLAVDARLEREAMHRRLAGDPVEAEKVAGVIIQGLLKGRRPSFRDDGQASGKWPVRHNSPLIYCWYKAGEPPMTPTEFYPLTRYEWDCTVSHKMGNGRVCPGGKHHRLSGVAKMPVAEVFEGGIPAWIEWLRQFDPETLSNQFVTLPPIIRSTNEWEIKQWVDQTLPMEQKLMSAASRIEGWRQEEDWELYDQDLACHFPMSSGDPCVNCFGHPCDFLDLCWTPAGRDPLSTGLFQIRTPNHPGEVERE